MAQVCVDGSGWGGNCQWKYRTDTISVNSMNGRSDCMEDDEKEEGEEEEEKEGK